MAAVIDTNVTPIRAWGASPNDWTHFDLILGLTQDLMPVVSNIRAIVSPDSSLRDIGKVPSLYNRQRHVVGLSAWTSRQSTPAEIAKWSRESDYGICLQTRAVRAIDIDDNEQGAAIRARIDAVLGLRLPARTRANSGKLLLPFTFTPAGGEKFPKRIIKTASGAVEILGDGQQFIAVGTHPSGVRYDWGTLPDDIPVLTAEQFQTVFDMLVAEFGVAPAVLVGAGSALRAPRTGLVRDDVVDFLDSHDMILGVSTDGKVFLDCINADQHSSDSGITQTMYVPANTGGFERGHFKCLHSHCADLTDGDFLNGLGVGLEDFEVVPEEAIVQDLRTQFAAVTSEQAWRDLIGRIKRDSTIDPINRDGAVDIAQKRFREITGTSVSKQVVRDAMKPAAVARAERPGGAGMEPWCAPYVWCKADDLFINTVTQEAVSTQSFNAAHGRDVKGRWLSEEGFQLSASQVALQEIQIDVVSRRMYLPWAEQRFSKDGLDFLNSYRPISGGRAAWQGHAVVGALSTHLLNLCGTASAAHLTRYLAYCVQNPGRKIRHSILIKGTEGDGKSLIGNVLELILGQANVGKVSPKVLNSDFNSWAEGHCVCIIEELRMVGHNRYDVANALKEYHTNDTVVIHRKGKDSYVVYNTQNYLCFTNFADAVPLNDSDRRYHVIFSPFVDHADLLAAGMDANYFDQLFTLIRDNVDVLRGWLMDVDLTGFDPNGRAPDSDAKRAMVAAAEHEVDQAIRELIDAGTVGVSREVVSVPHLRAALEALTMSGSDVEVPDKRGVSVVLGRMGYLSCGAATSWHGQDYRTWVRDVTKVSNRSEIRRLLDESAASGLL
jgi:hypothetical protein